MATSWKQTEEQSAERTFDILQALGDGAYKTGTDQFNTSNFGADAFDDGTVMIHEYCDDDGYGNIMIQQPHAVDGDDGYGTIGGFDGCTFLKEPDMANGGGDDDEEYDEQDPENGGTMSIGEASVYNGFLVCGFIREFEREYKQIAIPSDIHSICLMFMEEQDPEQIFDILQPLGEGAYGTVYKAVDTRDKEIVALKIIALEAEAGSMEKEIRLLQSCKSDYIVNFRGSFIKDDVLWLAMEYCEGGTVLDLMQITGEKLQEEQIQIIMRESLKGLQYLHKKNLVHRRIKAEKVLLNHRGQCKLADFGMSTVTSNANGRKTTFGSLYWIAPEVYGKERYVYDTKADIWSLGITAIEMATGKPPHSDKPPVAVILLVPKAAPPNLPEDEDHWSEDFRDFISLCCIKDPDKRPTATELLQHKWIRAGKPGLRVTLNLVRKTQPQRNQWLQQQRVLEENDDFHGQ